MTQEGSFMTSKERVRAAMRREKPDRIPAAFHAVGSVERRMMEYYGCADSDELHARLETDIVYTGPKYIGPELAPYTDAQGRTIHKSFWGYEYTFHKTQLGEYPVNTYYPLSGVETVEDVDRAAFPDPDWFDYDSVARFCDEHPDKAVVIGHEGPFQIVTFLIDMEEFFVLMMDEPEVARRILERMMEFELEYYRRTFEAAGGRIDVLRPHDDYGTQISLLFGVDMWREFFRENTIRLVELAHSYGAFYMQHSCGAVAPLIPEFIDCGVDALEPIQKIPGLTPEELVQYAGKIAFHGGVDTQEVLPRCTADEVRAEAEKYMRLLGGSGYVLMASQSFEEDVPPENIDAVYRACRSVDA
jgi:uroporphyrinogen decarboxylase